MPSYIVKTDLECLWHGDPEGYIKCIIIPPEKASVKQFRLDRNVWLAAMLDEDGLLQLKETMTFAPPTPEELERFSAYLGPDEGSSFRTPELSMVRTLIEGGWIEKPKDYAKVFLSPFLTRKTVIEYLGDNEFRADVLDAEGRFIFRNRVRLTPATIDEIVAYMENRGAAPQRGK